jgi:hypothetical protein
LSQQITTQGESCRQSRGTGSEKVAAVEHVTSRANNNNLMEKYPSKQRLRIVCTFTAECNLFPYFLSQVGPSTRNVCLAALIVPALATFGTYAAVR